MSKKSAYRFSVKGLIDLEILKPYNVFAEIELQTIEHNKWPSIREHEFHFTVPTPDQQLASEQIQKMANKFAEVQKEYSIPDLHLCNLLYLIELCVKLEHHNLTILDSKYYKPFKSIIESLVKIEGNLNNVENLNLQIRETRTNNSESQTHIRIDDTEIIKQTLENLKIVYKLKLTALQKEYLKSNNFLRDSQIRNLMYLSLEGEQTYNEILETVKAPDTREADYKSHFRKVVVWTLRSYLENELNIKPTGKYENKDKKTSSKQCNIIYTMCSFFDVFDYVEKRADQNRIIRDIIKNMKSDNRLKIVESYKIVNGKAQTDLEL